MAFNTVLGWGTAWEAARADSDTQGEVAKLLEGGAQISTRMGDRLGSRVRHPQPPGTCVCRR